MTQADLRFFFQSLVTKVGHFFTRAFVSDGEENFYAAWTQVMCYSGQSRHFPEPQWMICRYHVRNTWSRNYNRIENASDREVIKKLLLSLLNGIDEQLFDQQMIELKNKLQTLPIKIVKKDEKPTRNFADYIKDYLENSHEWAMIHRIVNGRAVGPTTNNFVENVNA